MKKIALLMLLLLTSGCTTTMYVAKTGIASGDKECTIQTHWYKTDYLIGTKADEALSVRMGERRPVTYKKVDDNIIYLGEKKRDIKVIGAAPVSDRFTCGKVEGLGSLEEFEGDKLTLTMHCKAKSSPLSRTKGYLPASAKPYVLKVTQEEQFSLTSARSEAPSPPTCIPKE